MQPLGEQGCPRLARHQPHSGFRVLGSEFQIPGGFRHQFPNACLAPNSGPAPGVGTRQDLGFHGPSPTLRSLCGKRCPRARCGSAARRQQRPRGLRRGRWRQTPARRHPKHAGGRGAWAPGAPSQPHDGCRHRAWQAQARSTPDSVRACHDLSPQTGASGSPQLRGGTTPPRAPTTPPRAPTTPPRAPTDHERATTPRGSPAPRCGLWCPGAHCIKPSLGRGHPSPKPRPRAAASGRGWWAPWPRRCGVVCPQRSDSHCLGTITTPREGPQP